MKNCLTFLFYFFSIIYLHCQVKVIAYLDCQVKVIDVKTPGSLSKLLGSEINSITELKINGKINSVDYTTLKSMKNLSVLDLSNSGADDGILPAQAFSRCNVLKSITLPASLVTISESAFEYASNVSVDASKCSLLETIENDAFNHVEGKIILPDHLENLPKFCFYGFKGTVVLPKNLKSIGEYAFIYSKINNLDLTQCPLLETIGNYAFKNANNLNLDLSKSTKLKNIGKYAFDNVEGKIILPDHLETLTELSFAGFNGTLVLPKNLKTIERKAFYDSKINTLDLTECPLLETLEIYAFQHAWITKLDLSKSTKLKDIGGYAFQYFTGNVFLPDHLESLPEFSFAYFDGTVVLPKNLKSIDKQAFYNSKIIEINLPGSLQSIADEAFYNAKNLSSIRCNAATPPLLGKNVFYGVNEDTCSLEVPDASRKLYEKAEKWKYFQFENFHFQME